MLTKERSAVKDTMKNRTRTICLTILLLLALAAAVAVIWRPTGQTAPDATLTTSPSAPAVSSVEPPPASPQPSETVQKEIQRYAAEANADGIVTETPDPYFIEKQSGYDYREPETIAYYSGLTKTTRHAMLFLPADYSAEKEYPVLYLLHGYGGSHRTWRNKSADIILQNLYYFENVPEMIVVCPNSNVNEAESVEGLTFWESVEPFDRTPDELVDYLMPYINQHYSVKTGRENTAVAGNSMGGRNALAVAYRHPELFGYVGAFSSSTAVAAANGNVMSTPLQDLTLPEGTPPFQLLFLAVGRSDNVCGNVTYELDRYMTQQGIDHLFYDTTGGHQNVVWQNALYNFAKKLFRAES